MNPNRWMIRCAALPLAAVPAAAALIGIQILAEPRLSAATPVVVLPRVVVTASASPGGALVVAAPQGKGAR